MIARSHRLAPEWDRAAYTAAEVGRLVDLNAARVRRWLTGYDYRLADQRRHQRPVVKRKHDESTFASFLDLVDLLFVKCFLDHGVSLQKVRRALDEARKILGTNHFARQTFFTDGKNVYLEMKGRGKALLQLLSGGQWVIAPIIIQLAKQIDFDAPTGLARRWYPLGPEGRVVLDPLVSFGRPTIVQKGIATANVYDFFLAEEQRVERVTEWMNLDFNDVNAAVTFERKLAR